jgi:hypothetical protein
MDLKARCVAELYQAFKAHKGQLFKVKMHMPNVIKTIVMCYKGLYGIYCQINSYVCADNNCRHTLCFEVHCEPAFHITFIFTRKHKQTKRTILNSPNHAIGQMTSMS